MNSGSCIQMTQSCKSATKIVKRFPDVLEWVPSLVDVEDNSTIFIRQKLNLVPFCSNFVYPILSVPLIVTEQIGFQPYGRLIFLLTLLTKLNSTQSYSALLLLKCLTDGNLFFFI